MEPVLHRSGLCSGRIVDGVRGSLTQSPTVGYADVVQTPSTESSAGDEMDTWLVTRGLIGNAMIREQAGSGIMTPPPGTEVDETRQTANLTGEVLNQVKSWNEID